MSAALGHSLPLRGLINLIITQEGQICKSIWKNKPQPHPKNRIPYRRTLSYSSTMAWISQSPIISRARIM